jgi:putative phosphoesterase
MMQAIRVVGLISDTHGLLRPEALAALQGSDLIIHAGDIGGLEILRRLEAVAPLLTVRGNNDKEQWAADLPTTALVQAAGVTILVIHDVKELAAGELPAGVRVVVSGHSHKPVCERRGAILFVNPGSAGPRRFRLPVCVGRLEIRAGGHIDAALQELVLAPGAPRLPGAVRRVRSPARHCCRWRRLRSPPAT